MVFCISKYDEKRKKYGNTKLCCSAVIQAGEGRYKSWMVAIKSIVSEKQNHLLEDATKKFQFPILKVHSNNCLFTHF